jgi:hypothetical protein
MVKPCEIEVDGLHNECLSFRPLPGKLIRGRFDLNRITEPMARLLTAKWPDPIPGQRIGIDRDGAGYIAEPLHDEEFAVTREKITKAAMKLAPPIETFEGVDAPSWIFWLKRAVDSGVARVVKGELPDTLPTNARQNFILAEPPTAPLDKLTAALERQSALFEKLLERLGEKT